MHRFFSHTSLQKEAPPSLSKEEERHLRVMRLLPDEEFELVDGQGNLAIVTNTNPLTIVSRKTFSPPVERHILALALLEPSHLDLVFEKASELGVTDFYLFPTQKTKKALFTPQRQERAQKILISALKQSKRLFLPTVTLLPSLSKLPSFPLFLADPRGEKLLPPKGSKMMIVGPESGFTEEEIASLNATKVNLGQNVLRAETAAIVASYWLSL